MERRYYFPAEALRKIEACVDEVIRTCIDPPTLVVLLKLRRAVSEVTAVGFNVPQTPDHCYWDKSAYGYKCPKCGDEFVYPSHFCPSCGTRLEEKDQ